MFNIYKYQCLIFSTLFLTGCPIDKPYVTPTPISSIEPESIITPISVISDELFKIEFGPGSKGVSNLGPSSKGVSNFGPSSKGVSNLKFNINFDSNLIRADINSFTTKSTQPLYIENLQLILEKEDIKIADISVIPKSSKVEFSIDTNIKPGIYDLKAYVKNNFEPLNVFSKLELQSNLEVKVVLYAKELNRDNLDISIRTKPIKEQVQELKQN